MSAAKRITDEALVATLKTGTEADIRAIRQRLVEERAQIAQALKEDKFEMLEERALLIESGALLRDAVIRAGATTDHDWRRRAVAAQYIHDKQIGRVNEAIRSRFGAQPVKVVTRIDDCCDAEAVADELQNLLNEGCTVYAFAVVAGSLVVVHNESDNRRAES